MPKNVVCKKCNNLVNGWCEKVIDSPDPDMQRDCHHFCEKTNGVTVQEWISVDEKLPQNFISVLGYMTDAGEFPPVRECYTVGNEFFFPALGDVHPVSHWCELPQPPKGE